MEVWTFTGVDRSGGPEPEWWNIQPWQGRTPAPVISVGRVGLNPIRSKRSVWIGALRDPVPDPACSPSGKTPAYQVRGESARLYSVDKKICQRAVKINKKESLFTMESEA